MDIIVSSQNQFGIIEKLSQVGCYGLDTETTGLSEKDRLFSIIIYDGIDGYYFNYQPYTGVVPDIHPSDLGPIFDNEKSNWRITEAKFDMRMLGYEGLEIAGSVHCTVAIGRVEKNNHLSYSLAASGKRIGFEKDDAVAQYIKDHKLFTIVQLPGKKKKSKLMHYEKVPFEIITKYGFTDAKATYHIAQYQVDKLGKDPVAENEIKLTKTCFKMERTGIKINREYVEKAFEHESKKVLYAAKQFFDLAGVEFKDSNKVLAECFRTLGLAYPFTEKGNPSFSKESLKGCDNELATVIKKIRHHEKMAGTYYASFLHFADEHDVIHANIRQSGTTHGRVSYSDPNLQNVPKEDDEEDLQKPFLVRKSFIPRPGNCFVMIDYDQMEFRMMLDYAGEHELIARINAGEDPHKATADTVGIPRKEGKTMNFRILYGSGGALIGEALGISERAGKERKRQYFAKMPKVKGLLYSVADRGKARGHIFNWLGRRCYLSDSNFAYILPNHLISGGCADVVKIAMNKIQWYIEGTRRKSRMIAQVHDELLFEMHPDELHLVPVFKEMMEAVYKPKNNMPLTCSVEHSWVSWGASDKVKGLAV